MGCGNSRVQPNVSKQAQHPSAKPRDKGGQQQAADPRNGAPKAAADPLSGPPKAAAKPGVPAARSSKTSALPPVGLKRGSVAPEPVSSAAQERGSDSGAPGPGSWPGSEKGAKPSGSGGDTLALRSEPRTARTDVTQRGVSLAFLQRMITSGAVQAKWSVDEVVERYIKPKTRAAWCPLFDLTPDECTTGKPSCFVSHAWSCSFGDLVSMLTAYSKQVASGARGSPAGSGLTLWIDIVCVNQHLHADHACLLTDDVMKVVDGTKQTLYCLDASFAALRRTWCLYEVWTTFVIKGAAGLTVLVTDTSGMKEAFDSFDVLQSRASRTKDHVRLLAAIQSNISAEQLNLQFKDALVESAVHEAEHFAAQTEKLEQARSETKAADLHLANGEHWEAERHYRLALQGYEAAGSKGRQGEDAVGVLCLLAACVGAQGFTRVEEAEELLREALAACTRLHGPEDKTTLSMLSHLAGCLHTRDPRSAEAEALHRQALEAQERTLGPDHPHTITTCANLANLLQTTQRYAEAEPLYRRALAARGDTLGSEHPEALSALYVLAVCVKEQGALERRKPCTAR